MSPVQKSEEASSPPRAVRTPAVPVVPRSTGPAAAVPQHGVLLLVGLIALDAVALADPVSHFPLPIVLSCLSHSLSQGHFVAGKLNILMSQCGPMHNVKGQLHAVLL